MSEQERDEIVNALVEDEAFLDEVSERVIAGTGCVDLDWKDLLGIAAVILAFGGALFLFLKGFQ